LANLLFVYNEQKRTFWAYLVGGIINVILNALFIPKWGMAGAAYATIISSGVSFLGLIYLSLKYTSLKLFNFSFFKSFILLTLASIGMMAFLMEFFVGFSLIIQVIVGAIIYFLLASLIWYLGKKFGFLNI
jgi:O-antigen/teichoic acid export membrane protein